MKNAWIIIFLFMHALASAQGPVISGDFNDLPFDEFVREVEAQLPVKFIYRKEWTRDLRISASGENMDLNKILSEHFSGKDLFCYFSSDNRIFITRDHPLVTNLPDYDSADESVGISQDSLDSRDLTEAERLYIEGRRKSAVETIHIGNVADHIRGQGAIIHGHIKDAETGEALVGATIFIEELSRGFITDINGYFNMSIPPGSYIFRFN